MKKNLFYVIASMVMFTSCSHDIDFSGAAPETQRLSADEIKAHVQSVFGVTFDPNQDWCTTQNGKVTISFDDAELSDVEKVQILTVSPFGGDDANGAKSLNESSASYGKSVTLYYDAPKMYTRLYAACTTKSGKYFVKGFNVGEQNVVFTSNTVSAARTRAEATNYNLKKLVEGLPTPTIVSSCPSFGAQRGGKWSSFANEMLYQYAPDGNTTLRMVLDDYEESYKRDLNNMIFNDYLVNKKDNITKIKTSNFYQKNNNYPLTSGDDPIIMAPISRNDSIYEEVQNCDLYYYYFQDSDLAGKSEAEQVQYLKDLPKYRALELWYSVADPKNSVFTMENKEIKRQTGYALVFWDKGTPTIGQTGSYIFPKGYRIGFMLRSIDTKTDPSVDEDLRDGELYSDGRLNTLINKHGHFKTAKLTDDDPRMTWFWANQRRYLCCESGSDRDINDIVFEVLGGIDVPPPPTVDKNKYTFCFEDTELGDYDLNDVVIRAYRKDKTHVVWQLVACGAHDNLYIKNIKGTNINEDTEVHAIFGKPGKTFINTEQIEPETLWVEDEVVVPEDFSFLTESCQPYIFDATTGLTVKIALVGQDPHAIMVPYEFRYPLEKICVKDAYDPNFNKWGSGAYITDGEETGKEWYLHPIETLVTKAIPVLEVTYEVQNTNNNSNNQ